MKKSKRNFQNASKSKLRSEAVLNSLGVRFQGKKKPKNLVQLILTGLCEKLYTNTNFIEMLESVGRLSYKFKNNEKNFKREPYKFLVNFRKNKFTKKTS